MKTSIYTRVSTEDQAREGYSLEVQREYLLNYAKQQNLDVYEVYSDEGISAGSTDRPALQKLLKDAKRKKFDLVIVYKIDRFSRRLKDLIGLVDELESYGVGFKSATEPFDTTTSAGKLMFQQLGSFAEFERNRFAERVFPGMVKSVQQGNWHGARYSPFGYNYNKQTKFLEVNEKEAAVVKLIFQMYLAGKSTIEITDYLNQSKHKTRIARYFYTKLIRDILRNRLYIGQVVWNKYHYDKKQKAGKNYKYVKNDPSRVIIAQGKHTALITVDDFNKVQARLNEKGTIVRKSRRAGFPFSGLLYCEKCNHRFFGVSSISNHRTGERKVWYRCGGQQQHYVRCGNRAVRQDVLENILLAAAAQVLKSERLQYNRWLCMTASDLPPESAVLKTDLASLQNHLKINREKQLKLTDLYLTNLLSEDTFKQKNEALRQEEEELRSKIAGHELLLLERENSREYIIRARQFLTSYDPEKKELDAAAQKEIAGLLWKKIMIKNEAAKNRIAPIFYAPLDKLAPNAEFLAKERKKCAAITLKPTAAR